MRFAIADPPYIGQAKKHYSHDPLCAEVDHAQLIERLSTFDAWALCLSSPSLAQILALCPTGVRVGAWVKPFASRVYVAGPYTKGDQVVNVRNAIQAAETLVMWRHTPFIPHLSHLWHTVAPHPWEFWLEQDIAWLAVCEALVRLPGESLGADKEVGEAIARGIPVYHSLGAFREATRGVA